MDEKLRITEMKPNAIYHAGETLNNGDFVCLRKEWCFFKTFPFFKRINCVYRVRGKIGEKNGYKL